MQFGGQSVKEGLAQMLKVSSLLKTFRVESSWTLSMQNKLGLPKRPVHVQSWPSSESRRTFES